MERANTNLNSGEIEGAPRAPKPQKKSSECNYMAVIICVVVATILCLLFLVAALCTLGLAVVPIVLGVIAGALAIPGLVGLIAGIGFCCAWNRQ